MLLDFDRARLLNSHLNAEHEACRSQLSRFIYKHIAPFAEDRNHAGKVLDDLWPKAREIGLFTAGYFEATAGCLTE